jgi:hypothetical protein
LVVIRNGAQHAANPWRLIEVSQVESLEVLEERFDGARPLPPEYDPDRHSKKPRLAH